MTGRRQSRSRGPCRDTQYEATKCHLCAAESLSNAFSKPSSWSKENREWLKKVHTQSIPPDAPVCRACEKFIKRNTGRENVVPRWIPKDMRPKTLRYCMVEGCGEMSHTTTHIVTHEIAQEYLDLVPTPESGSAIPQDLTLCNSHYQFLYRKVHYPEPCASCFTEPNYGGKYTRCCPDPEQISAFLKETFNLDGVLTATSKICKQCYLFHRQILQQQGEANTEVVPDRSLPSIVKEVERKIADFEHEPQHLVTDEGFLAWNACILSLQLAKTLQNDEAVLLPELYATFCKNIAQTIDKYENVARAIKTTPPNNTVAPEFP